MKALYCGECGDLRAPSPNGDWTSCYCGQAAMRWVDPRKGIAKVRADDKRFVRVIGIHNGFLRFAVSQISNLPSVPTIEEALEKLEAGNSSRFPNDEDWREFHKTAVEESSGYLFHSSRRACGMVIIRIGESNDITWEEDNEPT